MTDTRTHLRRGRRVGFTLVELMISIALVLLILIGVNLIFRTTADTVSGGQALNEALRAHRALSTNLQVDINGNAADPASGAVAHDEAPFILINSTRVAAFESRQDDPSGVAMTWTGTPLALDQEIRTIDGVRTPLAVYNRRNHRVDQLSFFSTGSFTRQSGNDDQFIAPYSSNEAMIWYGHLDVYNGKDDDPTIYNESYYPSPAQVPVAGAPNRDNFYATDWRLGRMAFLLANPTNADETAPDFQGYILDDDGRWQHYIYRIWDTATQATPTDLGPLAFGAQANDGPPRTLIQSGRYDLVGVDIETYHDRMKYIMDPDSPPTPPDLRNVLIGGGYKKRILTNPFVSGMPDSAAMARTVPQIGQGCTQFIVEFAGDFVTQGTNGNVTSDMPDGILDYVVVGSGANAVRSIRWYGFPRDVDGDGYIGAVQATAQHRVDVVPVSVIAGTNKYNSDPTFKFEYAVPGAAGNYFLDTEQGSSAQDGMQHEIVTDGNPAAGPAYTCIWDPRQLEPASLGDPVPRPYLIRIIATFNDRSGRLSDGLTQEYIFKLD